MNIPNRIWEKGEIIQSSPDNWIIRGIMVEGAEEYIGKTLNWSDIVDLFPNCYVALDNYVSSAGKVTAKLIYVCKEQDDMTDLLVEYANKGNKLHTRYTTELKDWDGLWQI